MDEKRSGDTSHKLKYPLLLLLVLLPDIHDVLTFNAGVLLSLFQFYCDICLAADAVVVVCWRHQIVWWSAAEPQPTRRRASVHTTAASVPYRSPHAS